jgi:hypothetical protein
MNVLQSRRFWTFLVAQVLSVGAFVFAHYVTDPFAVQLATMTIGLIEGLAAILIAAYTVEDVKQQKVDADLKKFFASLPGPTPPDIPAQMGHTRPRPQDKPQ